jgi:hypothetical protein
MSSSDQSERVPFQVVLFEDVEKPEFEQSKFYSLYAADHQFEVEEVEIIYAYDGWTVRSPEQSIERGDIYLSSELTKDNFKVFICTGNGDYGCNEDLIVLSDDKESIVEFCKDLKIDLKTLAKNAKITQYL